MAMEDLITQAEKEQIVMVIRRNQNKVISQTEIARLAKQNPNRARYTIELLLKEGRIKRQEAKNFGRYYKRYTYTVEG